MRNSGKSLLRLMLQHEGAKTSNRCSCLLPEEGMSWSLIWGEGRGGSSGWAGGVAWVVCPPPWWCWVQGSCTVPCFCSQHLRSGSWVFWSFCILLSIICPSCACMQSFLVPYSFFVFCCLRRLLSRCKHCGKGFQVPACLNCSIVHNSQNMETT